MNFKFFEGRNNISLMLEPTQLLTLNRQRFNPENIEFCFQFGDEEPIVFATGPNECSIRLSPTSEANITFNDNDRVFKLFAREIV